MRARRWWRTRASTRSPSPALPRSARRSCCACAGNLKKVSLELGGKSPHIVFPDADLDAAAAAVASGIFFNQGQTCTAGSRLYAHESCFEHDGGGSDRNRQEIEGRRWTRCRLPTSARWPRRNSGTASAATSASVAKRARSWSPAASRPPGLERGYFFEPTVFANAAAGMRIVREEIFGPVLTALAWNDVDDLVAMANDSRTASRPASGPTTSSRPTAPLRRSRPARFGSTATTWSIPPRRSAASSSPAGAASTDGRRWSSTARPRACGSICPERRWQIYEYPKTLLVATDGQAVLRSHDDGATWRRGQGRSGSGVRRLRALPAARSARAAGACSRARRPACSAVTTAARTGSGIDCELNPYACGSLRRGRQEPPDHVRRYRLAHAGRSSFAPATAARHGRRRPLEMPPKCQGVSRPRMLTIAIDPDDARDVWVGVEEGGLFRTRDGGDPGSESMRERPGGVRNSDVHSIVILPGPPKTILVMVVNALYASTDDGETWTETNVRRAAWASTTLECLSRKPGSDPRSLHGHR